MLKTKKHKLLLVAIVIFSMVAMYGSVPNVKAASLTDAKDTISDSDLGALDVEHVFNFTNATALLAVDDYIEITFPAGFTGMLTANVTCPGAMTPLAAGQVVTCTGATSTGQQIVRVAYVDSPTPGTDAGAAYTMSIATKHTGGAAIENVDVMVYIISDVLVTAHVSSALTFAIAGLPAATDVNGVQTTVETTATTTPFGTLSTTASSTAGQQLSVTTNADDGYVVTVFEDNEMINGAGSNINSFDNAANGSGLAVASAKAWEAPDATLDTQNTYGHMGITSEDSSISGSDPFGAALYAGFIGTSTIAVMSHDGPVNGTVDGKGVAQVAYTIEISALQEAGDYSTTLTYICTPQY